MFEFIGIVIVSLMIFYPVLVLFIYGLCMIFGFDELHPVQGVIFWIVSASILIGWWLLIGHNIHISFG